MLFQGLRPNRYYWEFFNTIRKILLLVINIFLPQDRPFYKATVGVILLNIILRIQVRLNPY